VFSFFAEFFYADNKRIFRRGELLVVLCSLRNVDMCFKKMLNILYGDVDLIFYKVMNKLYFIKLLN
jgi:hypothetical protein